MNLKEVFEEFKHLPPATQVVLVLVAVVLSAVVYGEDGAVPVSVVRISVFWAFMLVYALASTAILVQYAGGSRDAE